jgi:2-polyprenyl-3-methyl-5-hydroxy-6-metoxy-1,4-benzoquinol methylase
MQRALQPELLDSLPPHHPDALHNRRDIRLTNRILGNFRWLERAVPPLIRPGERTLEIGAGTGELGHRLARRGVAVDGLDLWPRPGDWPADRAWHQEDLRRFDRYGDYDVILGNLIFHQFSEHDLAALGEKLRRRARVIVACEPQRRRTSQIFYRLLAPLFGANHVSLHDAHVSIAAGFCGNELSRSLGLEGGAWRIHARASPLGVHRLIAVRNP